MSDISKKKSQFVKVYSRQSKSMWDDHSTILWLATVLGTNETELNVGFERYIYVHRESSGRICGISISRQLLTENSEFESRYLDGIEMYAFLLLHIEEIAAFCEFFKEEFIDIFLIPPSTYFSVAERYWLAKISDA
jgi:hypothetical protein